METSTMGQEATTGRAFSRRAAVLALMALPLGDYRAWAQTKKLPLPPAKPAHLSVDLNQWSGISVRYKGKETYVSVAEIFAALEEGQ